MTDFDSNPDPLKRTTDGDAGDSPLGASGRNQGGTDAGRTDAAAAADLTMLRETMEVVGADGGHVGVIDHVLAAGIKLNRQDSAATDGQHHMIPLDWVRRVDPGANRVELGLSKAEAVRRWTPAG